MDGRIFGGYRLRERLGAGSQAEVWLADAPAAGHPQVVLKIAAPGREGPEFKSRFLHEAKLAQAVDHPNVVRIVDAGQVDARLYLAMEHIDGLSFSQVIRAMIDRQRLIAAGAAIRMTIDALKGLHVLHEAVGPDGIPIGFVHRDIAPKNLMLDRSGVAKVIDLGIARSRLRGTRTATGVLIGTPGYMSPEQVRADRIDGRSDVFSMGTVLFELLTLDPLIRGSGLVELLAKNSANAYRPPSAQRGDLDPRLDAVVRRALMVDPAARYATARDFIEALEAVRVPSARDDVRELLTELLPDESGAQARPAVDVHAPPPAPLSVSAARTEPSSPAASGPPPRPAAPSKPVGVATTAGRGPQRRWGARPVVAGVALAVLGAWGADGLLRPVPLESVRVPTTTPVISARPSEGPAVVDRARSAAAPVVKPPAASAEDRSETDGRPPPTERRRDPPARLRRRTAAALSPAHGAARRRSSSATPAVTPARQIQALMAQARGLVERAPGPELKGEALGVVVRLNRLSAEAQRGRAVDLQRVRAALKDLEARLPR